MLSPNKDLRRAIKKSQHCQRNWDLTKQIPKEDFDTFIEAATRCPSKQNVAFYKVHMIRNRTLIEAVHEYTRGFRMTTDSQSDCVTHSQDLANLLVLFEDIDLNLLERTDQLRNDHTRTLSSGVNLTTKILSDLTRDKHMAVGIAAGYLNLTASLLGYSTGCCACFSSSEIMNILGLTKPPLLLMGIGYPNKNLGRRVHHLDQNFIFPTKRKQPIEVNIFD